MRHLSAASVSAQTAQGGQTHTQVGSHLHAHLAIHLQVAIEGATPACTYRGGRSSLGVCRKVDGVELKMAWVAKHPGKQAMCTSQLAPAQAFIPAARWACAPVKLKKGSGTGMGMLTPTCGAERLSRRLGVEGCVRWPRRWGQRARPVLPTATAYHHSPCPSPSGPEAAPACQPASLAITMKAIPVHDHALRSGSSPLRKLRSL